MLSITLSTLKFSLSLPLKQETSYCSIAFAANDGAKHSRKIVSLVLWEQSTSVDYCTHGQGKKTITRNIDFLGAENTVGYKLEESRMLKRRMKWSDWREREESQETCLFKIKLEIAFIQNVGIWMVKYILKGRKRRKEYINLVSQLEAR